MTSSGDLPTFETLVASGQRVQTSNDMLGVRWKAFGPIEACIHILEDPNDLASAQIPYQAERYALHPISKSPLTEPSISSITVREYDLENWEEDWVDEHLPHADYDGAVWIDVSRGDYDRGGDHDEDEDEADGDQDGHKLMSCCGQVRPHRVSHFIVKATTEPFVTIHDYITTVHAWLQTARDDILRARGVHEDGSISPDASFYVAPWGLGRIILEEDRNRTGGSGLNLRMLAQHIKRNRSGNQPGQLPEDEEPPQNSLRRINDILMSGRFPWDDDTGEPGH